MDRGLHVQWSGGTQIARRPRVSAPDASERVHESADLSSIDPRLLIWLSPSFPVGAFAYSHGLELAVERGWVHDRETLTLWLTDLIELGSLRNDLIVLAHCWRAAIAEDVRELLRTNELAIALQPSSERRLETLTQGRAFLSTLCAAWPTEKLATLAGKLAGEVAYPVAVGTGTAAHDMSLAGVLQPFAMSFVTNLISAAIRLSVVGQTDGQRVVAALMRAMAVESRKAADATLDDLGSATLRSDLASLAHEMQYSRLFRS
ncbi:MAG: urease accessory protein UreF [Hyphomicrobiaceae bacterium]